MRNALKLSLGLNILLVATGIFLILKRLRFQEHLAKIEIHRSYLDNPQYKEQVSIQSAYSKSADVVMLGDSHIYKARWDELLNRNDVAVRGIGSDVLAGYIHRLDQVLNVHPKVVCIEGGANDIYFHEPIDSIVLRMEELIDTFTRSGIHVILHTLPPCRGAGVQEYNAGVRLLNHRIQQLALHKRLPVIDLYGLFQADGILNAIYAQADGTHLVGEAYKIWAAEIKMKLQYLQDNIGPVLAGR